MISLSVYITEKSTFFPNAFPRSMGAANLPDFEIKGKDDDVDMSTSLLGRAVP